MMRDFRFIDALEMPLEDSRFILILLKVSVNSLFSYSTIQVTELPYTENASPELIPAEEASEFK